MSGGAMLRVKKLKGSGIIRAAAAHNKRSIQAEVGAGGNIDPRRSGLNECLTGPETPEAVALLARDRLQAAGLTKLRKDAVRALEFVVSLPPTHTINDRAFFVSCVEWVASRYGGYSNILSADIHRDEAAPHLHVLLLPLIDGRMKGSDLLGGRALLAQMHNDFHAQVANHYGLKRATARLTGKGKVAGVAAVLKQLKTTSDAALQSKVWGVIRECAERDPSPFMQALGIDPAHKATKPLRSMTAIFTSKGKGAKTAEEDEAYRVRRGVGR